MNSERALQQPAVRLATGFCWRNGAAKFGNGPQRSRSEKLSDMQCGGGAGRRLHFRGNPDARHDDQRQLRLLQVDEWARPPFKFFSRAPKAPLHLSIAACRCAALPSRSTLGAHESDDPFVKRGNHQQSGVRRMRPLFSYSHTERYKGRGSTDDAATVSL
jgi:hypothetical protein